MAPTHRARLAVLTGAVGVALAALGPATPAQAGALATGVTQTVTFNDPRGDTAAKQRIIRAMNKAVAEAPAGAQVRIVTWRWNYAPSTDTAIAALRRGVDIKVALNSASYEYSETRRLKSALGSRVVLCRPSTGDSGGGCISDRKGGTAHNKIMTLSQTGSRRHVVMVTAHNVSAGQTYTYNDLVTTAGDRGYYLQMRDYLEDSLAQRKDNDYRAGEGRFSSPGSLTETWAGPRAASDGSTRMEASTDTLAQILKAVPGRPGCTVYLPESKMDDTRLPVVNQIVRLKRAGCFVSASTRIDSVSGDDTIAAFAAAGIPWKRSEPHVHMKVAIVLGGGVPDFVLHGSEHPTRDFRRNDEILQKNTNPAVVRAYTEQYRLIARRDGIPLASSG